MKHGNYLFALISTGKPHKGVDDLIAAFRVIAAEFPGLSLVLAGQGVEEGIEHAHIYERSITIVGKLSEQDLLAYYQGARAVVIPSLIEGFSYPALEAHVLGAPVIARPVGAIPEILREYDTVAEDLSFGALVQALRQGLTKQRSSSTSSINIPQVHTVEQSTRELVRFYHEAVGS
jgi:glycosyltransferase involved in cell wall biosynthesis